MSSPDLSDPPVDYAVIVKILILTFLGSALILLPICLLSTFLVLAGIAWIAWGMLIIYLSNSSKKWPITQGVIIENTVGRIMVPSTPGWYVESYPVIAFRYTAEGVEYVSQKAVLFPSDLRVCEDQLLKPSYRATADFCARFPLNSTVDIHYNPHSPRNGVLVVGTLSRSRQHSIVFIVAGTFLLSLGLFLLYVNFWMT